jgi:peptidoglycan hydrolase-like protein with peptidoglycan-binding domain/Flp pilus assembly protein TadD
MRSKFIAAAVSILALAMPATAMAAGGGGSPRPGGSGGADHGAVNHPPTVYLSSGTGYDHPGGSPLVRALQRRLAARGFAPGPVDGLYGPRTEAATDRFQAATGLPVDGIAGPYTLAALSSPTPTLYPGAGYGSEPSQLVRVLQRLLTRAGYDPGHVDGLYGLRTERAVRRFQATHGLLVDGVAHPRAFNLSDQIHTGFRAHPAARHGSSPAPHPATARPTIASPMPASAPALVERTRRPSGGSSVAWVWLLASALAATALLVAARHTRRRRAARPGPPATEPGSANGHGPETVNGHVPNTFTRASEDDADPDSAFKLGVMFEEQNDPAAAMAAYRQADRQGHAAAPSNLGVLLERSGDLAGAEAAYRRADERGDPNGAFNLAMLLEEHNDLAGAEAAYRRADGQAHAAAASNLGVMLEQRGDRDGAQAAYRRADERGDANGAFNLAVLLEEHNDLAAAEAAYRRADQRGPAEVANASRAALHNLRAGSNGDHVRGGRKDPGGARARNGGDPHVH